MSCSVLVVDDDPAFRGLATRILVEMDFVVIAEAGTCVAARAAAADLRPDAALVDVGLPDGDGLALAQELAALPWRPRVVLTSSDPEAVSPSAGVGLGVGAVGFVAKDELPNAPLRTMLAGN